MRILDRLLGPGDRDAFAEEVRRRVASHHPGRQVEYDSERFTLTLDGDGAMLNLANLWTEVAEASRGERRSVAQRIAAALAAPGRPEVPATWEEAAPMLLPKLRSRIWLELLSIDSRTRGKTLLDIPHRVIGEHYTVELACDFPETVSTVNAEQLAKWGRSFDDALMTATRNLRQRPPAAIASLGPEGSPPVLYAVMSGDTYDATRLLTVDVVHRQIGRTFDAVAIPLHRGALLLADAGSPESLQALAAFAAQQFDEPYPNSGVPLRFAFGEWAPWLPEPGHAAREALSALVQRSVLRDYAEQKDALDRLHEQDGTDIFVGDVLGPYRGATSNWTATTWLLGCHAWLPRADFVIVGRDGEGQGKDSRLHVPWDRLVEIANAWMKPLDMFPPRWEVRDPPDAPTLERLAAAAAPVP